MSSFVDIRVVVHLLQADSFSILHPLMLKFPGNGEVSEGD